MAAHSQTPFRLEECDTIDLDKCYATKGYIRYAIDTTELEEKRGLFSLLKINYLDSFYCMLIVEKTDTFDIVYDSTVVRGKVVYSVERILEDNLYYVLVESEEEFNDVVVKRMNEYRAKRRWKWRHRNSIYMHLRRPRTETTYYPPIEEAPDGINFGVTETCERCQLIILHGREEKVYDCPLILMLYRPY